MLGDFEPLDENTLFVWVDQLRQFKNGSGPLDKKEADRLSKEILWDFCLRHWHQKPQSTYATTWIVDALGEVLEHQPADEAFALMTRANHRPGHTGRDTTPIVAWVALAVQRGYSKGEAEQEAADLYGCDKRSVQRYRAATTLNPDLDLADYLLNLKMPKPLPTWKNGRDTI